MAIYKVCPKCGAHLDPGEQCSCESMEEKLLDQLTVEMKRTDEFYQAARELGNYIRTLPLSQPQNDHLIKLIIDQVNTAERGAHSCKASRWQWILRGGDIMTTIQVTPEQVS